METEIDIKKAKLIDHKYLEVEYTETLEKDDQYITNEISKKCKHEAHQDLIDAYKKFIPHLALLSEFVDEAYIADMNWDWGNAQSIYHQEIFYSFDVTSISFGGSGDHEGVTITGRKNLKTGKVLNLNSPFTKFDSEVEEYLHTDKLYSAFVNWDTEVKAYINGKYAPSKQLELFTEGEKDTGIPDGVKIEVKGPDDEEFKEVKSLNVVK